MHERNPRVLWNDESLHLGEVSRSTDHTLLHRHRPPPACRLLGRAPTRHELKPAIRARLKTHTQLHTTHTQLDSALTTHTQLHGLSSWSAQSRGRWPVAPFAIFQTTPAVYIFSIRHMYQGGHTQHSSHLHVAPQPLSLCLQGDRCTFSHDPAMPYKKVHCKHYALGICTKGSACTFIHDPSKAPPPQPIVKFKLQATSSSAADLVDWFVHPAFVFAFALRITSLQVDQPRIRPHLVASPRAINFTRPRCNCNTLHRSI